MQGNNEISWRQDPPTEVPPRLGASGCAIAIPARDEAALIGPCLEALAAQQGAPEFAVALVLNNCRDGTAAVVARLAPSLPFALTVFEVDLPPELADAAWARRLAMNAAAGLVGEHGIVLTSDADSRADPHWVRLTMECFDAGADIVCGFVAPDFNDAPPLAFEALRRGALEFEYSQLTAELVSLIDPDPCDPWPNHMIETGANLAMRASTLAALGGVPHICPGEDQRLVAMARRAGYRIRHAFAPSVTTSSRVRGRAAGGWSDDLSARLEDERATCHPKLEPAQATFRRATLRARLRKAFGGAAFRSAVERLAAADAQAAILAADCFAAAWAQLEDASPLLARAPLLAKDLEADVQYLRNRVAQLSAGVATLKFATS